MIEKLKKIKIPKDEYIITGSTVLYFHNIIKKCNDVDIIVKPNIFNKNLKFENVEICNKYDYFTSDLLTKIFKNATTTYEGYLLMSLQDLLEYYKYLNRKKDKIKIKRIQEYIGDDNK